MTKYEVAIPFSYRRRGADIASPIVFLFDTMKEAEEKVDDLYRQMKIRFRPPGMSRNKIVHIQDVRIYTRNYFSGAAGPFPASMPANTRRFVKTATSYEEIHV